MSVGRGARPIARVGRHGRRAAVAVPPGATGRRANMQEHAGRRQTFRRGGAMTVHVGTSGWSYAHWEGVLYPHGLPMRDRLDRYTSRFRTVELNASYYRWPAETTFASWRRRLPPGFVLSVKAPRGPTHA